MGNAMGERTFLNVKRRTAQRAALVAAFAVAAATSASAQRGGTVNNDLSPTLTFDTDYLGYAASVSPRIAYSDNINLAPDGFEDGAAILSNLFSGNAIYSRKAFTGLIQGDLDVSYLPDDGDFNVSQQIAGVGTLTLSENLLYFDVSGSTSRQLLGDNARFSPNVNAGRNQRTNVHNFALSPYLNTRFNDGSAAEVRYRFSQVFVDNDLAGAFFNDSRSHEVAVGYDTGEIFDDLNVKLTAYGARTNEYGSTLVPEFEYEQGTLLAELEYALTPRFALTGAVGYDEIDSNAPPELIPAAQLSGINWLAGFRYRPNRRTDILLQYGDRFGDDYINASFSYVISERLQFAASGSRFFQTRAQAINSQFALSQRRVLDFAENLRNSGEGQSPNGIIRAATDVVDRFGGGAQTIGVGTSNTYTASLFGEFGRTTVGVSAIYSDDDFSFRAIETIGGSMNVQHQLARRITLYGDVFYRFADTSIDIGQCVANPQLFGFNPATPGLTPAAACLNFALSNGETNTVGATLGGRYQLYKNLSAFAEYSYTNRFSPRPQLEFVENFVQAGIVLDF